MDVIPAQAGIQGWTPAPGDPSFIGARPSAINTSAQWSAGVTALILCLSLLPSADCDELIENQARFGQIQGDVQVLTEGSAEWLEAHTGLPIETGDQIRVGEDSEAELSMAENVFWVAQANSELVAGHMTTQQGRITLRSGSLLGKVAPGSVGTGGWVFETPVAVCAVRGTEFALLHSEEDGTHLGVFQGTVEMGPAETAAGTSPPEAISAQEEGVLQARQPLKKFKQFTPLMRDRQRQIPRLRTRFQAAAHVWSPFTGAYRQEMRRKFIPAAKIHKVRPRPRAGRRNPRHP